MFIVPSELGTGVIKNLSLTMHLICVPFIGVPAELNVVVKWNIRLPN